MKYRRKTKTGKFLYVAKVNITARFIKEAYIDTFYKTHGHDWFYLSFDGFSPEISDIERYITDNESEQILPHIRIEYDGTHSALNIGILKTSNLAEKFTDIITKVIEKHGKKLEVQL